jgi:hypothetical protein
LDLRLQHLHGTGSCDGTCVLTAVSVNGDDAVVPGNLNAVAREVHQRGAACCELAQELFQCCPQPVPRRVQGQGDVKSQPPSLSRHVACICDALRQRLQHLSLVRAVADDERKLGGLDVVGLQGGQCLRKLSSHIAWLRGSPTENSKRDRRHTQTHTQTHTDTNRHKQTQTDTHRHTDTQTHRHTDTQTHRHTDTHQHHTHTQKRNIRVGHGASV